ncbi:hypothetical protein OsJ_01110 [Oryza sativa Japonica Group]|uniref:Uncharacterized protein n=1 Tax=Oryza sativa subsp. japonica TaxID=39947 RepID=B9EUP5_ORYSJ|nr:hypothetical protein OsJ_01110 [Oryza sativa Japonica Group]
MRLIRQYNSLFAFTSLGANIDRSINTGQGHYVFRINGVVHHRIGSLVTAPGQRPEFAQLYIYDTANELQNRLNIFYHTDDPGDVPDPVIVQELISMLDQFNPLVQQFRLARDKLLSPSAPEIAIKLIGSDHSQSDHYSLPTISELATLIIPGASCEVSKFDVIVQKHSGELCQLSPIHPALMSLQYPLLFPYGDVGFHTGIKLREVDDQPPGSCDEASMLEFYRYESHYRKDEPNPFTCCGRLSDQLAANAFSCIETSRLTYHALNQKKLRSETHQGISDAVVRGDSDGKDVGTKVILPSSFIGGRRYMVQNYHDSMAICRSYGPPQIFSTFTCNSKWPEIIEAIRFEAGQKPSDRSDMVTHVYHMKLDEYITSIKNGEAFGPIKADAIGIMTPIGPVQTVSCGGVMKAVLNVHITNGSETAVIALWGAHDTQFHAENLQQQADHGPVVILFVGLTVKFRDHQLALQGSTVCRWYPNAPIQETISLISSAILYFLCFSHVNQGNSYIVKIAIKDLVPAEAWWYRVAIIGVDPSDLANHDAKTAEFTFFGEIGYQLIGIPVLNLVASVQGARDIVPSKIKAVFGKQYVIRTSVSRGSLQRNRISYQVDSLMLASLDAAHTSTLPSHDASMASSQHGSSPADAIEPHTIIGSSLQSMTPSTPLVLPDPKLLAMAQLDKKRKSSAIDEDLAQEGSSPREHDCQKASVYDTGPFYDEIRRRLSFDFTKSQLVEKLRRLKKKYRLCAARMASSPHAAAAGFAFRTPHEGAIYDLARHIWPPALKRDGTASDDDDINPAAAAATAAVMTPVAMEDGFGGSAPTPTPTPRGRGGRRVRRRMAQEQEAAALPSAPALTSTDGAHQEPLVAAMENTLPQIAQLPPVSETEPMPVIANGANEEAVRSVLSRLLKEFITSFAVVGQTGPGMGLNMGFGGAGLNADIAGLGFGIAGLNPGVPGADRWRQHQILELEVYLKRIELVREQVTAALDELRSSEG